MCVEAYSAIFGDDGENSSLDEYANGAVLERLKSRMEKRFPPADPLFVAVMAAYTSRVDLSMKLHYLSCESGVGRAEWETDKAE